MTLENVTRKSNEDLFDKTFNFMSEVSTKLTLSTSEFFSIDIPHKTPEKPTPKPNAFCQ